MSIEGGVGEGVLGWMGDNGSDVELLGVVGNSITGPVCLK
jgi:hypothetical protein